MNYLDFDSISWHDAELLNVVIDREKEDVKISVRIPGDNFEKTLKFVGCYGLQAKMNFGFSPPDSILDAEIILISSEIESIKKSWLRMGLELKSLKCYRFIMSTTGSEINILRIIA